MRKNVTLILLLAVLLIGSSIVMAQEKGGTLRFAMIDTPPSLDQQVITSDLATIIAQHIFEGLYTFNSEYAPVPMLASDSEVSNDGKLITINLREGVTFHNGNEMTSEDVVASLERWGEFGVRGPVLFEYIDKVEANGKYSVNLHFSEAFSPWKSMLAFINGGPVILPKEIMEDANEQPISPQEYIGTGPYQFNEWNTGRYISLTRYDNYAMREEESDGFAGQRITYLDELRFIPVPETGTRVNGVKAGDYDYAQRMQGDMYESLKEDERVEVLVNQGAQFGELFFNQKEGLMTNTKLRQAVLAALDMEPVLQAAHGHPDLWDQNGSIMPEGTIWYSEAGIEKYSQGDPELAKELAEEAGYNNERIRFMTTTSYQTMYDSCVVIAQQLSEAGFNIDLQIYDWATVATRRNDPEVWDFFYTWHGFVPDPILYTFLSPTYPGWWDTAEKRELVGQFTKTMDQEERTEIWSELQEQVYTHVPIAKTGDTYTYDITSPNVKGFGQTSLIWPKFWNVWID